MLPSIFRMQPVLLIDVVGLSARMIGEHTPAISELARRGAMAPMSTVLPAVTCSAQATMLTGLTPREHGAVGNGWFDRETGEVGLWRQSNALVRGPKLYERVKDLDPSARCAKIFWWWNLGARVDLSITPRPFYPADGRKIVATYASPREYGRGLEERLGPFPFFDFWGPKSGLPSSRWLADAAIDTLEREKPALTMVYLPHLDYDHQRFGPHHPRGLAALREVDALCKDLIAAADRAGDAVVIVSEYSINDVTRAVHVNRLLREAGLLEVRETPAGESLDTFASRAFAVSDHQIAHVYAKDAQALARAKDVLARAKGVEQVLDRAAQARHGIDHPRAGDLVLVAERDAWFTYYYWLDDELAPDFARTVDIHRKPGYDPCELFLDPKLRWPTLRVARRLAQKKLGMRYLMDVIPLDASLVRGSHGRLPDDPRDGAVFLSSRPFSTSNPQPRDGVVAMTSVAERVLALLAAK
jgi:predicted AlkP superfamily pyrophosphatase or phosphodiesterase